MLINTPDASDVEIADFIHHKGERDQKPEDEFHGVLVSGGGRCSARTPDTLYRQQRQKEQEQREAEQRRKLEETVQCAEFLVTKLEEHLAGQRISASSQKEAIGFLQFQLQQLPATLQQRIRCVLQGLTEQATKGL